MMSDFAKRSVGTAACVLLGLAVWGLWPEAEREGQGGGTHAASVTRSVGVLSEGEVAAGAPAGQFPPVEYPAIATERLIRVSLGLLAKNGEDVTKPMPSRHRVLASSPAVVDRISGWARAAGYEPTPPVTYHEHGGEEHFQLDLVRIGVPEPRVIEAEGREVFAAVGQIPGAYYQSWMGGHGR